MAGTILTSSPHYFSAVEDYHAFLMKNWLALATLRSKQKIPKSHCLYEQRNFVQPWKRFHILCQWTRDIHVLSRQMSHVKKAQAYTHWPTGCPKRARMKDPSLHEPSQRKSYKWASFDESPQKGQSTTSLPIIKASPNA